MKLFWTVQLGIGATALAFLAAHGCGGNVVVDGSTGTSTTETEMETISGSDTSVGSDTSTEMEIGGDCVVCACDMTLSEGGCEDLCKSGVNGGSVANFCDGAPALSQCAACISAKCGISEPSQCM